MKILLTGANGYIGSQLLLLLLEAGHEVVAMLRSGYSPSLADHYPKLTIIVADLLKPATLEKIPDDIDAAYYLVHAMSYGKNHFPAFEAEAAKNFVERLEKTKAKQIIYLGGLGADKSHSPHLISRYKTECIIKEGKIPSTVLRAGIIVGAGSASFEIIRDLAEKLPVMIAPKWVYSLCQPIAIANALRYLTLVLLDPRCLSKTFEIGGPERLSYKEMLLGYAKARDLKRYIFGVPVFTPRLSSYWLYFVTSVNFALASALVESVKSQAICTDNSITKLFPFPLLNYQESILRALDLAEQNPLVPSWKDALISGELEAKLPELGAVPHFGCLIDRQTRLSPLLKETLIGKIWSIGGETGWYYMDWAWTIRGWLDKLVGGVGLQRGRTHSKELRPGSSLDFWRVVTADKERGRLLLYAEMKVPGEAWLEFTVIPTATGSTLTQTASFRPKGILGRLYWYLLFPLHWLIFRGMANRIAEATNGSYTTPG